MGSTTGLRRVFLIALASLAAGLVATPACAGPITISKQSDLQFGKVVMIATTGTIIVSPTGLATYSGVVSAGGVSPGPARFLISGDPGIAIQLRLTYPLGGTYGVSGVSQLDALKVQSDYALGFQQLGTYVKLRLDASGKNTLTVGGTMKLNTQTPGLTDILFPIDLSLAL
jgi:hypothetical protein